MNCLFLTILQFIDAARKYTELSYIVGDAGGHALGKAMICAILADAGLRRPKCPTHSPSGQDRSRILATLFKDERSRDLPAYAMLEAMYDPHENMTLIDTQAPWTHCQEGASRAVCWLIARPSTLSNI